jgi:hypothetical protein
MGLISTADVATFYRLGTLNPDDTAYYQFLADAVSEAFQKLCGRQFIYDVYTEFKDGNGTSEITLLETPVEQVANLWYDRHGNYGSTPGSFADDKLLVDGTDYALKLDGRQTGTNPPVSDSGIVVRLHNSRAGIWLGLGSGFGMGYGLTYGYGQRGFGVNPGCVKVEYMGGFGTIPTDIRSALCQAVGYLKSCNPMGVGFSSESDEGYSYSLLNGAEEAMKLGSVRQVAANYRRMFI